MNAKIRDQIIREGKRSSTYVYAYLESVRTIREMMETMNFLPLTPLSNPVPVYNVDSIRNAARSITHCAEIIIQFQEHREKVTAEVTDLGKNQMILGYTWLSHHNPEIDWTTGMVKMT